MFADFHYALRSKLDGQYLVARLPRSEDLPPAQFLLLFKEDYLALSYVNQHAPELGDRFGVESLSSGQLKGLMRRWGFQGVGLVQDPLEPRIEFMTTSSGPF